MPQRAWVGLARWPWRSLGLQMMRTLVPMVVLVLASLLLAMVARSLAGGAVAVALFLTLLVGGGMVLAINRR